MAAVILCCTTSSSSGTTSSGDGPAMCTSCPSKFGVAASCPSSFLLRVFFGGSSVDVIMNIDGSSDPDAYYVSSAHFFFGGNEYLAFAAPICSDGTLTGWRVTVLKILTGSWFAVFEVAVTTCCIFLGNTWSMISNNIEVTDISTS